MWELLTPFLFAILIIWLMARWVRLPEYTDRSREWLAERLAKRPANLPAEPEVSAEELAMRTRYKVWREEILALPMAEARQRCETALLDGRQWNAVKGPASEYPCARLLSAPLRRFFEAWSSIEDRFGGVRVFRGELELYRWPDIASLSFATRRDTGSGRSIRIGVDRDGDALVVRERCDALTVVHNGRPGSREVWFSEYPSLFHFLLLQHRGVEEKVPDDGMERARRMIDGI